ncbi:hypothetical protein EDD18DRAFT_1439459 [Armillaria luteobubalina]|uniref:Uncharacterized protein n=1 Tax=Armillaria luteobubalina TaxID=153913 RepID=A0AA39UIQ0_9AGAR|nr:hypothetical protein EDD18DRAFT_1439459 [Armillaria luteobubalina]
MDVVRAKVAATPTPASVEESRENRLQRLKSRFRDRGGRVVWIFQPTGENKLVGILLAHRTAQQRRSRSRSLSPLKANKAVKGKKAKKQAEDESVAGPSTVKLKSKAKAKPKSTTGTKAKRRGRPPKASVDEPPTANSKPKASRARKSTAAAPPDDDSEDIPLSKAASKKSHTARPPPMTPIQEADEEEDVEPETVVAISKGRKKALPNRQRTPSKARAASKKKSKAVGIDEDALVDNPPKGSRAGSSKSKSKAKVQAKAVEEPEVVIKQSAAPSVTSSVSATTSSKLKGKAKTVKDVDQAIGASAQPLGKASTSRAEIFSSSSSKSKAKVKALEDVEVLTRKAAKTSTKIRKTKGGNDAQPASATSLSKLKSDGQVRAEKPPPKAKRRRTDEDEEVGEGVVKKPRVEEPQVPTKKRKAEDVLEEVNTTEKLSKRNKTSKSLVVQDDVKAVPPKRMKTSTSKLKENVKKAPRKPTVKKGPRKSVVARLHAPLPPIEDEDEADPIDFLS